MARPSERRTLRSMWRSILVGDAGLWVLLNGTIKKPPLRRRTTAFASDPMCSTGVVTGIYWSATW